MAVEVEHLDGRGGVGVHSGAVGERYLDSGRGKVDGRDEGLPMVVAVVTVVVVARREGHAERCWPVAHDPAKCPAEERWERSGEGVMAFSTKTS